MAPHLAAALLSVAVGIGLAAVPWSRATRWALTAAVGPLLLRSVARVSP